MNHFERRESLKEEQEKQKQRNILHAKEQLQQKKKERKDLEYQLLHSECEQDKQAYTLRLQRKRSTTEKLSSRLKSLGVTEKRGRPKKEKGEHYQEKRKKFTAHLQPETVAYLKELKLNGAISSVSELLDELVAKHQKMNR